MRAVFGGKVVPPKQQQEWTELVFYKGESLGYRIIYVWIADQDLMITVQTNSQPPKLGDAINALYEVVKK